MRNILITCLSTYGKKDYSASSDYLLGIMTNSTERKKLSENQSLVIDEEGILLSGYTTNEPAAKSLIVELAMNRIDKSKDNNTLDEVLLICTDSVRHEKFAPKENTDKPFKSMASGKTITEYFISAINEFAYKGFPSIYNNHPIVYKDYAISDMPDDDMLTNVAIKIAEYITSQEDVCVHLDFNGGMRFIATTFLSIINLINISQRSSGCLGRVYSTNYQSEDKINLIELRTELFKTPMLTNAISECIRYGRIDTVMSYFENLDGNSRDILDRIKVFMERLQLCSTGYILTTKGQLNKAISSFLKTPSDVSNSTDVLFRFVARDIQHTYSTLLTKELPDMILWCLNHGFIQQAITFCSEDTPWYIVEKKIFIMSESGKKAFQADVKNDIDNNNKRRYHIKDLKKETKYREKYSWFTFLQYRKGPLDKANRPYWETRISNEKRLEQLWDDYMDIKQLRHEINHANMRNEINHDNKRNEMNRANSEKTIYQQVREAIEKYVEELKELAVLAK